MASSKVDGRRFHTGSIGKESVPADTLHFNLEATLDFVSSVEESQAGSQTPGRIQKSRTPK